MPLALVLPAFLGVTGTLYSGPAADGVSLGTDMLFMTAVFSKLNRLEDREAALPGAAAGKLAV